MIAPAQPLSPALAGRGPLGASAGADPVASAFAALLAGLLPPAVPVVTAPRQASAESGPAGGPALAGPATPAAPAPQAAPADPLAPALPAAAGAAAPPPPAGAPVVSEDPRPPARVQPAAGLAHTPPPTAPQVTASAAEPSVEPHARASAAPPLERLPSTPDLAASPVPVRSVRELAPPAGLPPVANTPPVGAAAAAARPALGATGPAALTDRAPGPFAKAIDPLPAPEARAPAVSAVPPTGPELLERAPTSDAAADPAVELTEIAPARAERTASEPLGSSQRAAPPPLVQVGVQIATAAARRVERMVVQLEPAALGRVEVRLDFSHDNRVSALIAADRPETLEALQRDSRALERSLQDAGLRLADNALSFSLRQEQRRQQGAAAGRSDLPPVEPLAREDARAAQWFRAERVLDIRI